jgi:two-component system response regulator TctD
MAKDQLSALVFPGESAVQPDAIEVVAYRLRKKLSPTDVRLVTLRGLGYLLERAPSPDAGQQAEPSA